MASSLRSFLGVVLAVFIGGFVLTETSRLLLGLPTVIGNATGRSARCLLRI
ncbi:hypothetical protein [Prochlorococcus marinus]|uniref:hypothetical protein n=1 Tax=Prochlorococcus marinus TaxID=1219 RepID=UPI0002DEE0FD|nr:hypothetical protein [Prochlorococcus marinus]